MEVQFTFQRLQRDRARGLVRGQAGALLEDLDHHAELRVLHERRADAAVLQIRRLLPQSGDRFRKREDMRTFLVEAGLSFLAGPLE